MDSSTDLAVQKERSNEELGRDKLFQEAMAPKALFDKSIEL